MGPVNHSRTSRMRPSHCKVNRRHLQFAFGLLLLGIFFFYTSVDHKQFVKNIKNIKLGLQVRWETGCLGSFVQGKGDSIIKPNCHGVTAYTNVCIEKDPNPERINIPAEMSHNNTAFNTTFPNRIVIYGQSAERFQVLHVGGAVHTDNDWPIYWKTGKPPATNTFVDYDAYFITVTCPTNLHHFYDNEYRPLYSVLKETGALASTARKPQVFYRKAVTYYNNKVSCMDVAAYRDILMTLPIREKQMSYWAERAGTCFPSGVFGIAHLVTDLPEIAGYVLKQLKIDRSGCPAPRTMTLINRGNRRMRNIEALTSAAREIGGDKLHVQVVKFEKLSKREQVQVAHCSDILVGVQGAGLQWMSFMRPRSVLIEVSWGKWGFKYYRRAPRYSHTTIKFSCTDLTVPWEVFKGRAIEKGFMTDENSPFTEEVKAKLMKADGKAIHREASCSLDVRKFRTSVTEAMNTLDKEPGR